jgi:hypothetical protein
VLKVPNEAFTAEELDAQTAATARLAAVLPDLHRRGRGGLSRLDLRH